MILFFVFLNLGCAALNIALGFHWGFAVLNFIAAIVCGYCYITK